MNFVKLYIGDYQRDTGHLSMVEHGAYLLMLQHYYATEKPLPTGRALHRLLRAETKQDRLAIDSVVTQFWCEKEGWLVNHRADEELSKAEHQRDMNREIGKRGGRPKQTESVSETDTESVTESLANGNPNQTPDTRHQTKEKRKKQNGAHAPQFVLPDWIPADDWAAFEAMRDKGRKAMTDFARVLIVRALDELRARGYQPSAVLRQSVRKGWQDVYPVKAEPSQQNAAAGWARSGV